jgi:hypothetical protein
MLICEISGEKYKMVNFARGLLKTRMFMTLGIGSPKDIGIKDMPPKQRKPV